MIKRIRGSMQRGQALTELALLLPVLAGFFALTLQGGVVLSDQVNLEHYAYEGGQWGVANRTTATTTDIENHIKTQMCGSGKSIGASDALTRFCRAGSLSITVTTGTISAEAPLLNRLGVVRDALATTCQSWTLGAADITVAQGASANISASISASGSGTAPVVTLSAGGLPSSLSNGTPVWNPPATTGTSVLNIAPSIHTDVKNYYTVTVRGVDQCGVTNEKEVHVNVTSGGGPGTVTIAVPVHIDGLLTVCIPIGSGSTFTIKGAGFVSGATVTIGNGASAVTGTTSVSGSTSMAVTVPAPSAAGVYDVTVTNPDGTSTTLFNAITVATTCTVANPDPNGVSGSSTTCAANGGSSSPLAYRVVITWNEQLLVPWLVSSFGMNATQRAFCQ